MDDVGDLAVRRRQLPSGANWVVDGNGHTGALLAEGAAHHCVTGSH